MRFHRLPACALGILLAAPLTAGDWLRVVASSANIRLAPTTASRVVARVERGELLELLQQAGEWYKVETASGVLGFVHGTLVEPARSPATSTPPAPSAPPAAAAPTAAPPPSPARGVRIAHRDVGCVVAGEHPRLDACLEPADAVGRARVVFRAAQTDPWYYVDMGQEGACHSAVLPKPKAETKGFEYFVDVMDRGFTETLQPDRAPEKAYAPRVVRRQAECEADRVLAAVLGRLARPVVVGIVRDASGRVLEAAAARALESKLLLSGFSPEGVVVSSTGTPPGAPGGAGAAAAGAAGAAAGAGGGISLGTAAVVGGVAAAAGVAAVAVASGGDEERASLDLSGRWVGLVASGAGLAMQFQGSGVSCSYGYDINADLRQSSGAVSGQMSYTTRRIACSVPSEVQRFLDQALAQVIGTTGSVPVSGTATSSGALTLTVGGLTLNGTYTSSTIDASGVFTDAGVSGITFTLKLVRP